MTVYHSLVIECSVTAQLLITLMTGHRLGSTMLLSAAASL